MTPRRRFLVAALAVVPLVAATPPALARPPAKLLPARMSPLELEGTGFHRRERVRVTVTPIGGAPASKRVRADRHGAFHVEFGHVDRCGGIEAVAAGRRGSRASFVFSTADGCPAF
jgi:hypothetical protein